MGAISLDQNTAAQFRQRILSLTENSQRRWGKLSVTEMLAHLTRSFEISLGKIPQENKSNVLLRWLVLPLFLHVLPFPKGKIKAPEHFLPAPKGQFDAERQRLLAEFDEFQAELSKNPERRVLSMAFGQMPLSKWALLNGKHVDHHLRQFGV